MRWDFPGGPGVKNPPANVGDTGLTPGPGRSHIPWVTKPVYYSYWARALGPVLHNKRSQCNKKPTNRNEEQPPARRN